MLQKTPQTRERENTERARRIRVLVVEDSLTVRKRLVDILGSDPGIELVGEAGDGKRAIELCLQTRPDVITMDMMLPLMSGLSATEYIMAHCATPILVVSASINRGELFKIYEALAAGAVDVLEKPTGLEPGDTWDRRFIAMVKLVARIRVITHPRARLAQLASVKKPARAAGGPAPELPMAVRPFELVAIGASTGGPGAILEILRSLPRNFRLPILLVLHINEPFGTAFADWLDAQTSRPVDYGKDGMPLFSAAGRVVVAPADRHMIVRDGFLRLNRDAERHSCRPSVDVLFESVAAEYGASAAACLLTGMGRDGALGLLKIREAGGFTIAQDEATSVVYGMPREAALLGAAREVLRLGDIGARIAALQGCRHGAGAMNVLIVDDSLTVRMNLSEILDAAALPTVACATVAEARRKLAEEEFSLVILDILLPDGDGIELLKEIRAMPTASGTAVMLLSTEAEIRDRVRGLTTGADEYVGKPYDPGYVVARARELVRRNAAPAPPGEETVLVIDDSVTFREALKAALEQASYRVIVSDSGEDGLHVASDRRPTAIVVDGQLPGIDGATVIRRIRLDAALRGLPCLLLTASEDRGAEMHALEAGADAFVRKDEDIAVILARLKAVLRSAGARGQDRGTASLLGPKKILAVDDSETHLQELAEALRADGYELVLARSGEEALQLLMVQQVDCVLLDLMMPGIGGRETCRRVKSTPAIRDIPVVMLTAVEDREAMIKGLGAGADDYISKSSDFDLLRARVLAQIRRKQFEDETRRIREQLLRAELEAVEARAAREMAEQRAKLVAELEAKNEELESFSYSVAHDLRAPLRSIDGFGLALLEDYAEILDDDGKQYLSYVRESAQQMSQLIDDMLALSQVTRGGEFEREAVDLTRIARAVGAALIRAAPNRQVDFIVADGLLTEGDARLMTIAFENLLGNAWKYSGQRERARIEVGAKDGEPGTFFVRDNGAGFDMAYADKLFGMFQRLHAKSEFEGTGIGLATVQRVIRRHGGRIWADAAVGEGATFFFTLDADIRHAVAAVAAVAASPGERVVRRAANGASR